MPGRVSFGAGDQRFEGEPMSMNTLEYANQLLAENGNLKQKVIALESDATLCAEK